MQHFSKFIVDNWQVLLSAAILILTFILQLIKKKPLKIVSGMFENLYQFCIDGIKQAEATGLSGAEKNKFAVDFVISQFKKFYPESFNDYDLFNLRFQAFMAIESILSTPTKKGGCGREKEAISKGK